jgi:hypothetical protein
MVALVMLALLVMVVQRHLHKHLVLRFLAHPYLYQIQRVLMATQATLMRVAATLVVLAVLVECSFISKENL